MVQYGSLLIPTVGLCQLKLTPGVAQAFNDGTITALLTANSPEVGHGTGSWTIESGTGGSFVDASDPNTSFTGVLRNYYTLRWSILTDCATSTDDVIITFAEDGVGDALSDFDANSYTSVWIGGQLWMTENLKVTHYPNGDAIPLVTDNATWGNLTDDNIADAYSYYNNNASSEADTYGALYTYAAAIGDNWARDNADNQGVCPDGWHLPTNAEWDVLETYLGANAGSKLAGNATLWTDGNLDQSADFGASGFFALPSGYRTYFDGMFFYLGTNAGYWSASEYSSSDAFYRDLVFNDTYVGSSDNNKSFGCSVRCIRD